MRTGFKRILAVSVMIVTAAAAFSLAGAVAPGSTVIHAEESETAGSAVVHAAETETAGSEAGFADGQAAQVNRALIAAQAEAAGRVVSRFRSDISEYGVESLDFSPAELPEKERNHLIYHYCIDLWQDVRDERILTEAPADLDMSRIAADIFISTDDLKSIIAELTGSTDGSWAASFMEAKRPPERKPDGEDPDAKGTDPVRDSWCMLFYGASDENPPHLDFAPPDTYILNGPEMTAEGDVVVHSVCHEDGYVENVDTKVCRYKIGYRAAEENEPASYYMDHVWVEGGFLPDRS